MYSCTWCRKSTRPVPIAGRYHPESRRTHSTHHHKTCWERDFRNAKAFQVTDRPSRWWPEPYARQRWTMVTGPYARQRWLRGIHSKWWCEFFSHLSRSILHRKQPTPPSCQPKKLKRRGLPPPRRRSRSKRTRQRRIRERPLPRRRKLTQNGNAGEFRTIDTLMLQYHGITWTFSQPHCTSPNSYARIHRPATYLQKGVRFSEENGLIGGSSLKYLMLCRPRKWRCVNNHGNQSANELHDT